uniref:DUF223 domain-containing protein n=1 Tax=Brassica oleracea var. oleracea TaxID=109376 RepID=A0A0D3BNF3_BRAOL
MANTRVFFSDLKSGGKCSSVVEARLLRYWEAWNVKRGSDLMWVDMLLIDVNSTIMQATIYANRLPRFRSKLAAGKMFSISGFDVAQCAQNYRLTDSPLLLRFSDLTDFDELAEPVSPLPQEGFRFRNHSELAELANTNTQLPDIIGEITAVKSTVNDSLGEKDRIMATIKLDKVFFSDLKSGGKCSSVVEARLLRYWEAWNVKRGSDLMWVDMLLIDVNSTIMQATIYANRLPRFRSKLAAGKMFSISGFDVAQCAQNYRLTDSPLLLRFSDLTDFDELAEPVSPLPQEGFRFRNHSELAELANTNTQLPDIIGEITAVKSTVNDSLGEKDRIMATIKLDNLFDAQAVSFHKKLEDMNGDPRVIVATSINSKMVGGGLFLNATSGTHIYFDKETTAGEVYFYNLVARDTGVPSVAPLLKGYAKVETLTVAELNNFITSATSQEIDFICTGKVVRLDVDKGWCYVACAKYSKKLQRTVSALECTRCNNTNAVGVL